MNREKEIAEILKIMESSINEIKNIKKEYKNKDKLKIILFDIKKCYRTLGIKIDYLEDEVSSLKSRWEE